MTVSNCRCNYCSPPPLRLPHGVLIYPFRDNWLVVKSNNGNPCSDSSSRKNTGRCVHAAIVALHLHTLGVEPELDEDTDGVEYEPDGDMGVKEGDRDANMGFAWNIQREDEALFGERMAMARKIIAVYKFPIEEPQLKDGTYGRDKIHVNERICTGCRTPYEVLPDTDAILVGQVGVLR